MRKPVYYSITAQLESPLPLNEKIQLYKHADKKHGQWAQRYEVNKLWEALKRAKARGRKRYNDALDDMSGVLWGSAMGLKAAAETHKKGPEYLEGVKWALDKLREHVDCYVEGSLREGD